MKLSIIEDARVEVVVPRISQYANTQSRINAADFFSNHPFHIRVEEFSRRIWAPAKTGEQSETHWFYERARGQYREQQANRTAAEAKVFLRQFPKDQLIAKTDLAKFENSWDEHPRYVNLGGEKNFAQFARRVGEAWDSEPDQFNEDWFKRMVSRAILFRRLEKVVSAQPWYNGGYRANIVAYSIAMLSSLVKEGRATFDIEGIWKSQSIDSRFEEKLARLARVAEKELSGGGRGISNVTEWAKRPECWDQIQGRLDDAAKIFG